MRKFLALILAVCLLLTGCSLSYDHFFYTAYWEMEYARPDMTQLQKALDTAVEAAQTAPDIDTLEARILDYYAEYDNFLTNYDLAYIRYCKDVNDIYWQKESSFCMENATALDVGLDTLYRALAKSPFREELEGEDYFGVDFFSDYDGESYWDDTFLALQEEESALISRYYDLSGEGQEYDLRLEELYVELIALRQEQAAHLGYASYPEMAYELFFYRDYTPKEAAAYFELVAQELAPMYRELDFTNLGELDLCSERQNLAFMRRTTDAMGGNIQKAFTLMEAKGLYDISISEDKYDICFETWLDSYYVPFLFLNAYGDEYDKLQMAHEFGHFAADYVCGGSFAPTDISEVHSQAMEYLTLCYGENTQTLTWLKLADSLCLYVEQSAFSSFELQVYDLEKEDLTVENVRKLYAQVARDFGLDIEGWDPREYVHVIHLFIEPMYMASYVASNDVAFQLYQLELDTPGAGLAAYQRCLYSEDACLADFIETYSLEDPFSPERVKLARQTLESINDTRKVLYAF